MGVELIMVRHGRTAWNREVRFRGRMDLPLDEFGRSQARATARSIQARWPDVSAVYTSPLLRARQTAEPIAEALGQSLQPHSGLLDIDYGEWTGLTPMEARRRDPERYELWKNAPQQVQFPAGESLSQVQGRLAPLLEEVAQLHAGRRVVLVGHLVVNRVLICTLLGIGLGAYWRIGQETCAINLAQYADGGGRIITLNDTGHLSAVTVQGGAHV